ncbi:MAG TPA: hypothetical protein VK558_01275 [Patescibacteria group bacterium]|nr:hypothetical protein [Patescibacteria group bacterium]
MDEVQTTWAIAGSAALFGLCLWRERQPHVIGKPRLFPYIPVMLVLVIVLFGLLAHAVTLLTGKPLTPRGLGG